MKLAAQQKPPTKRGTSCAAATSTSDNLNNTDALRYADNEAQKPLDMWIVEHHLRPGRMATDRLTRVTEALLAVATSAWPVLKPPAAK